MQNHQPDPPKPDHAPDGLPDPWPDPWVEIKTGRAVQKTRTARSRARITLAVALACVLTICAASIALST